MTPRRRWALLLLTLAAAAGLSLFGTREQPVASAARIAALPAARQERVVAPSAVTGMIMALRPRLAADKVIDAFTSKDWTPPPPPPPPAPPPAAPSAPPLPYTVLGKKLEDGQWQVFLSRQEQLFIAKPKMSQQRSNEAELLFIGAQITAALNSYYQATPVGQNRYPSQLEDLLRDPRYPGVRRHLRRIYVDPMTGKAEWGLIAAPGGGFLGVYSLSPLAPLKQFGFDVPFADLAEKKKYSEWQFIFQPSGSSPPPAAAQTQVPVGKVP